MMLSQDLSTKACKGNIHSIETCGAVDGPGLRFVLFMQGCPMRCTYCHNPDTWSTSINKEMTVAEVIKEYEGVKEFCKGGVTVTGGEPLLQARFVLELFKELKSRNVHTALDTSGIVFNNQKEIEELLNYTDLVLLDLKCIDEKEHINLTGCYNRNILNFAKYLSKRDIPTWIRHVLVPNVTEKVESLEKLGKFISKLRNVKKIEILPYHSMAKSKYKELNIEYKLEGTREADNSDVLFAKDIISEQIKRPL